MLYGSEVCTQYRLFCDYPADEIKQQLDRPMNNATILVVDDVPQIRRVLRATLSSNGYYNLAANNGQDAINMVIGDRPDLILLNANMPVMCGFEAFSKIRLPFEGSFIMVTVRDSEHGKVVALDSGADDYVVEPFAIGDLFARIRASLRRSGSEEPLPKFETPELSVDLEKSRIDVRGERAHLSPQDFDVLRTLVSQKGKLLKHERLRQSV